MGEYDFTQSKSDNREDQTDQLSRSIEAKLATEQTTEQTLDQALDQAQGQALDQALGQATAKIASLEQDIKQYKSIFNTTAEAIFIHDAQTAKIIEVNDTMLEMYGFTKEEALQLGPNDSNSGVHPYTHENAKQWMRKARTLGPQVFEWQAKRKNGEFFWTEVALRYTKNGTTPHITAVVRDITNRRQEMEEKLALESQIQQAQKLESLGVLAGGIAHDFNNLLVGILGNAGLALMDLAPESPARESVQAIEVTAKRAADLVKQMLAYSGKGRFVVEKIELQAIVEEMTHLLEISISKNAVMKFDFAPNVPVIEADAAQIRQIIINLVTNASEAIGEKSGIVSIATGAMECDKNYLSETYLDDDLQPGIYSYIEVSDTGCGMCRDTRDKVFDPFFTTKFTGRGLGLAAVIGITRGHRGAIKIYSEPGKGSTFKALFPSIEEPIEKKDRVSIITDDLGGGLVLLVDDEETVRAVGKRMLERLGFEVVTAEDGRQALEIYQHDPDSYRFVLLDLTMPHLDGEQCFRELRRVRKDVCVVLSSGYSEQDLISRFAGKGLAGFIQKPYQLSTLSEKLGEALHTISQRNN